MSRQDEIRACKQCRHEQVIADITAMSSLICPNCGLPYKPAVTDPETMRRVRANLSAVKSTRKKEATKIKINNLWFEKLFDFALIIFGVLLFGVLVTYCSTPNNRANQAESNNAVAALTMCQAAMKSLSKDPETANIPYVEQTFIKGEYLISWGQSTKFMRMRNGFGMEIPVSGYCIVSGSPQKIIQLSFDGKSII
jgi:ribosomal protein L28